MAHAMRACERQRFVQRSFSEKVGSQKSPRRTPSFAGYVSGQFQSFQCIQQCMYVTQKFRLQESPRKLFRLILRSKRAILAKQQESPPHVVSLLASHFAHSHRHGESCCDHHQDINIVTDIRPLCQEVVSGVLIRETVVRASDCVP